MKQKFSTAKLVQLALFSAIIIILSATPLGYIPINPTLRPTTVHIPVIIGGILLGPVSGGILGAVFGLTSLLKNTYEPTITSFVFSPFYSAGGNAGNIWSLVICFVPRILIGVFSGLIFRTLTKVDKKQFLSSAVAGLAGSLTNTILVLGGIYLFFGEPYAAAKGKSIEALFGFLMMVVGTNGIPEAIVAAVVTAALAKPLLAYKKKTNLL